MFECLRSRGRGSRLVLAGVALAAASLPLQNASAVDFETTFNLGTISAPSANTFEHVIAGAAGKTFLDHWLFEVTPQALANAATVTMQSFNNAYKILPASLTSGLFAQGRGTPVAVGVTSTFPGGGVSYIDYTLINPGQYDLQVGGTLAGKLGGSYAGTLSAEPIPEPGTIGMIFAGLGLMGYIVRRRNGIAGLSTS